MNLRAPKFTPIATFLITVSIFLTGVEPALAQQFCSKAHGQTSSLDAASQAQRMSDLIVNLTPVRAQPFTVVHRTGRSHFQNSKWWGEKAEIHEMSIGTHKIEIMSAVREDMAWALDSVVQAVARLPRQHIDVIKRVRINAADSLLDAKFRKNDPDFSRAAATAGDGKIDIFPVSLEEIVKLTPAGHKLMRHEFGHLIAERIFGSPMPNATYIRRAERDLETVSRYGDKSWCEDFAEAVEAYITSSAGNFNPRLRQKLANRFAFLDEVFAGRRPQSTSMPSAPSKKLSATVFINQVDENHVLVFSIEHGVGLLLDLR